MNVLQFISQNHTEVLELTAEHLWLVGASIVLAVFIGIPLGILITRWPLLNKPVVALSYHEKISSLMAGVGMGEYCQNIDRLDVDLLVEQFLEPEKNAGIVKPLIEEKVEHYRKALDQQYAHIFNHLCAAAPR